MMHEVPKKEYMQICAVYIIVYIHIYTNIYI